MQGEEVVNFCMNEFTFKASKSLLQNDKTTPDIDIFIQKLFENSQVPDTGRKVKRVRKEYRRMTEKEREDYHRAVNMLKQDKVYSVNKLLTPFIDKLYSVNKLLTPFIDILI